MTVGNRIKQRRIELGLTQTELAERMGYSGKTSVCMAEKCDDNITTTKVQRYADALGVTPGYLMGWEDINGVPIPRERADIQPDITDYRADFVRDAIRIYTDIRSLPPERRKALEEYLRYLLSQS